MLTKKSIRAIIESPSRRAAGNARNRIPAKRKYKSHPLTKEDGLSKIMFICKNRLPPGLHKEFATFNKNYLSALE